jgi:hypothetical protein
MFFLFNNYTNMKTKILSLALILIFGTQLKAQQPIKINISGYLETYYVYDFNKPTSNNRPNFIYSHNRHNEVNLNLGFLKANYSGEMLRGNLALMAGTYTNANLAAESGVLKNIFEANIGVKISKTQNIWFDAGIFPSHIGSESAISKDCWVLTRNIVSENTPYYEAGAKLSYATANNKFTATLLYLNGWQKIMRQDGNSKPAGGLQLTYKPNSSLTFNYSNYYGTEGVDEVSVHRFYHNFYAIAQLTDVLGLTAGFDYGTQQKLSGQSDKSEIFAPVLIAQYKFQPKWAVAGRVEFYKDSDGIIINTGTPNGFSTTGYSINIDYAPVSNATFRIEGKTYDSKDQIFIRNNNAVNYNTSLTASLALSF